MLRILPGFVVLAFSLLLSGYAFGEPGVFLTQKELARITLKTPRPTYPSRLIKILAPRHGLFQLQIDTKTGKVTSVKVLQTMHSQQFDAAVRNALIRWRFRPGGPALVNIPITYDPKARFIPYAPIVDPRKRESGSP